MDNPQMKVMMYIMPFMIMVFRFILAGSICLILGCRKYHFNSPKYLHLQAVDKPKEVEAVKIGGKKK